MQLFKKSIRVLSLALAVFCFASFTACSENKTSSDISGLFYGETDEKIVNEISSLKGNTGFSCEDASKAKNVILIISDGMSLDMTTLTRLYNDPKGFEPLFAQKYLSGEMNARWAGGPITDSAASATALSTGIKTWAGKIGTSLVNNDYKPFANIPEAARLAGKKTGVVATVELFHATPAGFSAHVADRNNYEFIAEQMAYANYDVLLGGGSNIDPTDLSPEEACLNPESRRDKEDLLSYIKEQGYQYVTNKEEMDKITDGKIWGAFADGSLPYEIDSTDTIPTLPEMSLKALDLLNKDNDNGFFLMIEASHPDHAGHSNDPVAAVSEVNSWNNTFKTVVEWAQEDGNTVVLSTSDHATGGLHIGTNLISSSTTRSDEDFMFSLRKATNSSDVLITKIQNGEMTPKEAYKAYGLDPSDYRYPEFKKNMTGEILRKHLNDISGLGWTSLDHTGDDVLLYGYSPKNDHPHGYLDSTELNNYICHTLGLSLDETTSALFANLTKGLKDKGYKVKYDEYTMIAKKDDKTIEIPASKNYCVINGETHTLPGVTAYYYTSEDVTWGPKEILDLA